MDRTHTAFGSFNRSEPITGMRPMKFARDVVKLFEGLVLLSGSEDSDLFCRSAGTRTPRNPKRRKKN